LHARLPQTRRGVRTRPLTEVPSTHRKWLPGHHKYRLFAAATGTAWLVRGAVILFTIG